MRLAYLALGSNQGARRLQLAAAVRALGRLPGSRLRAVSPLYETEFVGTGEQDPYLNACVLLETGQTPEDLLESAQALESAAGRPPDSHMRPRPLDVDLLMVGEERRDSPRLRLPHPRLAERRFVLQPLADLDPELVPPGSSLPVRELLAAPGIQRQSVRERASGAWWEEA